MKKKRSSSHNNLSELSVFLEPREIKREDTTEFLDRSKILRARRQAKKIIRAGKPNLLLRRNTHLYFTLPVLLLSGFYWSGLTRSAFSGASQLSSTLREWISNLSSPIENIPELNPEDNAKLRQTAELPMTQNGPHAALALAQQPKGAKTASSENSEKPVIYIASNLPNGTSIDFILLGKAGKILSDREVLIRMPLTITRKLAKTPPLQMKDGQPLPVGNYEASVSTDQSLVSQVFFLGHLNPQEFGQKLQLQRESMQRRAHEEYLQILSLFEKVQSDGYTVIKEVQMATSKQSSSSSKKGWRHFHQSWQPAARTQKVAGHFFAKLVHTLEAVTAETVDLEQLANHWMEVTQTRHSPEDLQAKSTQLENTLIQLQNQLTSTSKLLENPTYLPSLDTLE